MNNHAVVKLMIIFGLFAAFSSGMSASENVKEIRDNLFQDQSGNLYFRMLAANLPNKKLLRESIVPPEFLKANDNTSIFVYRNHLGRKNGDGETKVLRDIVDVESWERISQSYYKDANNVYFYSHGSMGGALFRLTNCNPDTVRFYHQGKWTELKTIKPADGLKNIKRYYLSDGKTVFFGASKAPNIDIDSFRIMQISDELYGPIGRDKLGVLEGLSRWTPEDYQTLIKNIIDEQGELINKSDHNIDWIRAFNKIIEGSGFSGIDLPSQ